MSLYIEYVTGKRHVFVSSSFSFIRYLYIFIERYPFFLSAQFFLLCLFILNMSKLERGTSWYPQVFFIRYLYIFAEQYPFFLSD